MDAAFYDLAFRRGDTFACVFVLKQDDATPIDLTDSEIQFVFETRPRGCVVVKSTRDGTASFDDAMAGRVALTLTGDETFDRDSGDACQWWLKRILRDVDGQITEQATLIEGRQIVSEGARDA